MKTGIIIESLKDYLEIVQLLQEQNIHAHYAISHEEKYQLLSNYMKTEYSNGGNPTMMIWFDEKLAHIEPSQRPGGNPWYQNFLTGTTQWQYLNLCEYEILTPYQYTLRYYDRKIESNLTLKENEKTSNISGS